MFKACAAVIALTVALAECIDEKVASAERIDEMGGYTVGEMTRSECSMA